MVIEELLEDPELAEMENSDALAALYYIECVRLHIYDILSNNLNSYGYELVVTYLCIKIDSRCHAADWSQAGERSKTVGISIRRQCRLDNCSS